MAIDDLIDTAEPAIGTEPVTPPPPSANGWERDKNGKEYVKKPGGARGVLYRRGTETVAERLEREAAPKNGDKRPHRKVRTPKKPPPPAAIDLRELERLLAEALKSPAVVCAMFGDQWSADHFTQRGPYLARQLVLSADGNPWLRSKLEEIAAGGDMALNLITLIGVSGAFLMYIVPPIVYFLNVPLSPKARLMLEIPPRKDPDAVPENPPAPAPPGPGPQPVPVDLP